MVDDIRLVVCDIDGTLIGKDEILHTHLHGIGEQLAGLGVQFTVATGRTWSLAQPLASQLGVTAPAIVSNGGTIIDRDGTRLRSLTVPLAGLETVIDYALAEELSVTYCRDGREYMANTTAWLTGQQERFGKFAGLRPLSSDAFTYEGAGVEKLTIVNPLKNDRTLKVDELMRDIVGGPWAHLRYHVWCVEIGHPDATKDTATEMVTAHLGIDPAHVLAIGNDLNDVNLLNKAGVGVAVADAVPETKAAADHVTTGRLHDGVLEALERFVPGFRKS